MIVLANDGISQVGVKKLENNGFKVITTNVAQEQLIDFINKNSITCLLVRSATKVRKDIIDSCKSLKLIGRGGVGMDNIDVEYAKTQGLSVINYCYRQSVCNEITDVCNCCVKQSYKPIKPKNPATGETRGVQQA